MSNDNHSANPRASAAGSGTVVLPERSALAPTAQYDRDLSASVRQVLQFPLPGPALHGEQAPRFHHLSVLLELKRGPCLCLRLQRQAALGPPELEAIAELRAGASEPERLEFQLQERIGLPLVLVDELRPDALEPVWGVGDAVNATLTALATGGTVVSGVGLSELRQRLQRETEPELRRLLHRFIDDLEPQSRDASGWPAVFDLPRYNLIAIHDPARRRNRLQALRALPYIAPLLLDPAYDGRLRRELLQAVDAGDPLVETLSRRFGVTKAAVKHMAKVAAADIPSRWRARMGVLLRIVDALVPERRPVTREQWNAFDATERTVAGITAQASTSPLNLAWLREATLGGIDDGTAARIRESISDADMRAIFYMRLALHRWARHRAGSGTLSTNETATRLCGAIDREIARTRLPQLWELVRRWDHCLLEEHTRLLEEREKLAGRRWETVIPAPVGIHGFRVVPLTSARDLAEEGERMRHCVARYVERCFKAESMIFSLRDEQGASLSTFELVSAHKKGKLALQLRDQREYADRAPRQAYRDAAAAFVHHLESDVGAEAIQAVLSRQRSLVKADKDVAAEALYATAVERASARALPRRFQWEGLKVRLGDLAATHDSNENGSSHTSGH